MSVLFLMVPAALALAATAIAGFVWAARNGQFDEVDTPPVRILLDESPIKTDPAETNQKAARASRPDA